MRHDLDELQEHDLTNDLWTKAEMISLRFLMSYDAPGSLENGWKDILIGEWQAPISRA